MANRFITIHYEPQETGPAEVLHGKVARINNSSVLSEVWRDDIVLLSRLPNQGATLPTIKEVFYRRFPLISEVYVDNQAVCDRLIALFDLLHADSFLAIPIREGGPGLLRVAHHPGMDPRAMVEALGVSQADPEGQGDQAQQTQTDPGGRGQIPEDQEGPWRAQGGAQITQTALGLPRGSARPYGPSARA